MDHLTKTALHAALRRAFTGTAFNICGIRDAYDLLKRRDETGYHFNDVDGYATLHALHMTSWEHIDAQARGALALMIARILGIPADEYTPMSDAVAIGTAVKILTA